MSFKYDPFERRVYKQSPNATSVFVYDGDNLVQTVNSTGGLVAHYAQTMNIDEPLALQRSGTTYYYEADGLGSITSLTASNGSVMQSYTYDSFGNVTNSTGSVTNFLQYTGREFDTEAGLYYYRARYYDPTTGRFITEDPIGFGGGMDFYKYVLNDPVLLNDPLGLWVNTGHPANPKTNTIVCNGQGGVRVQLGGLGTRAQADCLRGCIEVHEETHVKQALAANPKVCKRAKDGIQIGYSNLAEQRAAEIAASNAEIGCLKKEQKSGCDKCKQIIEERIKQMEGYRNGFANK